MLFVADAVHMLQPIRTRIAIENDVLLLLLDVTMLLTNINTHTHDNWFR